jgi:tRNA uridine 5-carboxymethylaminomethyl modification enzyme
LVTGERAARSQHKVGVLAEAADFVRRTGHDGLKLDHWFRRGENSWPQLPVEIQQKFPVEFWPLIETDFKFEGHLRRQRQQVERLARQEGRAIPPGTDYMAIGGLKKEAQVRLAEIQPHTLGQAGRISGITPADLALLAIWLKKQETPPSKETP